VLLVHWCAPWAGGVSNGMGAAHGPAVQWRHTSGRWKKSALTPCRQLRAPRTAQQPGQSQLHPCRALRPQRACVGSGGGWWWGASRREGRQTHRRCECRGDVGWEGQGPQATTRASERTRSVDRLARINCLSMSFKATGRPVAISTARYTDANPPWPSRPPMRYPSMVGGAACASTGSSPGRTYRSCRSFNVYEMPSRPPLEHHTRPHSPLQALHP
jgi:hypothetical protein